MMKPLVGISCCTKLFGLYGMPNHAASDTYVRATDQLVRAVPVLLPANGHACDIATLLSRLGGTPEDAMRDAVTLPLIRAAIAAGLPLLAICRGLQELNVALGGSLHQRLQDLPGRIDHSTPIVPSPRVRTGKAHAVRVVAGSYLHRLAGAREIAVNSLHNQGIDRLAPGLVVEGTAPDGTIEAVRVANAAGFAFGVQWHPEYDFEHDAVSRRIFEAFGQAVAERLSPTARAAAAAD